MMHRHVWKVVARDTHPSWMDVFAESGRMKFNTGGGVHPSELTRRVVIVTYRCNGCGSEKVERV